MKFKRELGNGRWDRILKRELIELSVADNYDDAKLEWEATGEVWWGGKFGWQREERPDWIHRLNEGVCICGHPIVYHYGIRNTINGSIVAVGSDHINAYMILKDISKSTGLKEEEITEAMIEEWLSTKVEGMKNTAWWKTHGDEFVRKFNAIKEIDLRFNVRPNQGVDVLRKRADRYGIASIVWRWNHPNNSRAQINGRGYPNNSLMEDLDAFYSSMEGVVYTNRKETESEYNRRKEILDSKRVSWKIKEVLDFYGFENRGYLEDLTLLTPAEKRFLVSLEKNYRYQELSQTEITSLIRLLEPPTEESLVLAQSLGIADCEKFSAIRLKREIAFEQGKTESDRLNSGRTWEN